MRTKPKPQITIFVVGTEKQFYNVLKTKRQSILHIYDYTKQNPLPSLLTDLEQALTTKKNLVIKIHRPQNASSTRSLAVHELLVKYSNRVIVHIADYVGLPHLPSSPPAAKQKPHYKRLNNIILWL